MALISNLGEITLYRGDCFQVPLFINIGSEETPVRFDFKKFKDLEMEIYLGVYLPNAGFEQSFIRKMFTHEDSNDFGDIIVKIDPQDTLYVPSGSYKYTIKARMVDPIDGEWVSTIVDKNTFKII